MRAGRISVSRIDAGSGAPCSCSMASSSASAPRRRFDEPCHVVVEAAEDGLIDRLDFLAQLGERAPPDHPQHVGVGPFAPRAAGTELAFEQPAFDSEPHQHGLGRAAPRP